MPMVATQNLKLALPYFLGAVATAAIVAGGEVLYARSTYADYREKLAKREHYELQPYSVDPSWVISGSPVFRIAGTGGSPDKSTTTGIWEATGPTKFVWHYGVDETIYILEGSVEIEYLGNKFTLIPGESTHFAAGTMATWVVPERVKKKYVIYKVGPITRIARRLFNG